MERYSIKRAAILMVAATVVEKVLGFGREMVIASRFGASGLTDAYIGGYLIPFFITALLNAGLVNVYTPLFLSEREIDEDGAWDKINSISTHLIIILLVMTALGVLFSRQIVSILYPGFNQDILNASASISRIFFIGVFIYSWTIIEGSLLNCFRKFVYPLISISLLSVGTIIWVLLFGKNGNINSIAWGYIAGALAGFAIQYMKLKQIDGKFRLNFKTYSEFASRFFGLLLPVLVATSMSQVNVFVDRIFASYLPGGSMSYLSYGNKVVELPIALFSGIISTIIFPDLIEYVNNDQSGKLKIYLNRATIVNFIFLIPSFVGLSILSQDIVKLLYERNAFSSIDTINTASALFYYGPTIILYGGMAVISKVYYSMKDTVTLMYISVFTIILNAVLDYVLMKPMGFSGLALATSLVAVFQLAAAYMVLKRKINVSMDIYVFKNLVKICAACGVMAGVLYGIKLYMNISSLTLYLVISISAGVLVYFALLLLLRVDEMDTLMDKLFKRNTLA